MNKIYELREDSANYAVFYEIYDNVDNTFFKKYWEWKEIDLKTYNPVKLKLYKADNGKKNFQMDIGSITGAMLVLSEKAVNVLKDILEKTGQIIPIETESKKKKFYGFYPNKNVYDSSVINFEKSDWRQAEKGKIIYKVVLNSNYIKDDYLFTLFDDPMKVYVTEKFKKLVEENDLKGFDFSKEILVSD